MRSGPSRDRRQSEFDEYDRFEALLFDLSARFVSALPDQIDDEILDAQRAICECLQLDASLLWQWTEQPAARLRLTHMYRPLGGPPAPGQAEVRSVYPWCYGEALAGRMYANSTLDDLPPEAARDKETFEFYGVKSNVGLPLVVGGEAPVGMLTFHTSREHRQWTGTIVLRLQLVARFFANALERKRTVNETRLHLRQLAHLNRVATMAELATALAHELNQPLGAILRNAEAAAILLQRETTDLGELRAIVADIRRDDERAGSVIDRMRSLLRQRSIEPRDERLPELVDEVISLAFPDAASRGVRIISEVPKDIATVHCERVHVQQVLLNLVVNGMDAIGEAAEGEARVVIRARPAGEDRVEVSVSDTGGGLAPATVADVFEPFFTTKPEGLGMGLAISRTLVEAHGGRLWVGTDRGEAECGACFRFTLRTAPASEDSA